MRKIPLIFLLVVSYAARSQTEPSYAEQLSALEQEMDSLSIFFLIDSLMNLDESIPSELMLRMGYTTNVTSAGRDFGVTQSSLSPGVSYYHHSGAYADLSGYWNSGVTPAYNPTVVSIGYLGYLKDYRWNYTIDAERWIYHPADTSENPLTTSLGTSLAYNFKYGFASLDYSFLFGNETAHRIIGNLTFQIELGRFWIFKSVNLFPSVNMMVGNGDIIQLRTTNQQISERTARRIDRITNFANLTDQQRQFLDAFVRRSFRDGKIDLQTRNTLLSDLRSSTDLSLENQEALLRLIDEGAEVSQYTESDAFGVLNYSITLPLSLNTSAINLLLSYTYSIPVELPGEEILELDPIGYFGASISYRIQFK